MCNRTTYLKRTESSAVTCQYTMELFVKEQGSEKIIVAGKGG